MKLLLACQRAISFVEVLMVMILIAILAAVAVPQLIDFDTNTKDSQVRAALGQIRTGIALQYGNMILRCGSSPGTFPTADSINANNITFDNKVCSSNQVSPDNRSFVDTPRIPANTWGATEGAREVIACKPGISCIQDGNPKAGKECLTGKPFEQVQSAGWCYDQSKGKIWANSANSRDHVKEFLY